MDSRIDPSRLTLARRLAGLTKSKLAQSVHVSPGTVVLWEDGKRDPTKHLSIISDVLGINPEFLLGNEVPTTAPEIVSFRKRQDATRAVRDRAAAAIDLSAGILTPAIHRIFGRLPEIDIPDMSSLAPEAAAISLREHWGLGTNPIKNIVWQLEARGARVFWIAEPSSSLSAFCRRVNNEPFVILNTNRKDGCRSRFDACHELGHLVLHRDIDFDKIDAKKIEREADAFASAFLLPRETFVQTAPAVFDIEKLFPLKALWGASVQAMVRRLHDVGVFSDWQYTSAYKWMSAQGWRRAAEPLAGAIETSALHWKLCDRLERDDLDPASFARSVQLTHQKVFEMMPILGVRQMNLSFDALIGELPPFDLGAPNETIPYED